MSNKLRLAIHTCTHLLGIPPNIFDDINRKPFEPDLYPGAGVLGVFNKYFGSVDTWNLSEVKNAINGQKVLGVMLLCCKRFSSKIWI